MLSVYSLLGDERPESPALPPPSSRESGQLSAPVDLCDPELSQEDSLAVAQDHP